MPWGWVVLDGRQFLPPGSGPLATAVVFDTTGAVHWMHGDVVTDSVDRRAIAAAFQSYPTLLARDGRVPLQLREPSAAVEGCAKCRSPWSPCRASAPLR